MYSYEAEEAAFRTKLGDNQSMPRFMECLDAHMTEGGYVRDADPTVGVWGPDGRSEEKVHGMFLYKQRDGRSVSVTLSPVFGPVFVGMHIPGFCHPMPDGTYSEVLDPRRSSSGAPLPALRTS